MFIKLNYCLRTLAVGHMKLKQMMCMKYNISVQRQRQVWLQGIPTNLYHETNKKVISKIKDETKGIADV